jgi:hypothetical protein
MRVVAKQKGYYGGSRRRPGDIFDMAESAMKKDAKGAPMLPKWVEEAQDELAARKQVADAKRTAESKNRDAAVASSGGAAARRKVDHDLV